VLSAEKEEKIVGSWQSAVGREEREESWQLAVGRREREVLRFECRGRREDRWQWAVGGGEERIFAAVYMEYFMGVSDRIVLMRVEV